MGTYTYVSYFVEEDVIPIQKQIVKLREELDARAPYMDSRAYEAASHRLDIIGFSLEMLLEPVPKSFGG